jgi:hypothetical protein
MTTTDTDNFTHLMFPLAKPLHRAARIRALQDGMTLRQFVTEAIAEKLQAHPASSTEDTAELVRLHAGSRLHIVHDDLLEGK